MVNRVRPFITLFSFARKQFTCCCCGRMGGGVQSQSHKNRYSSNVESNEHHCHHKCCRGCPGSRSSQQPSRNPCCPNGHHSCVATNLIALNSSRVSLDEASALSIWLQLVPTTLACLVQQTSVEYFDVSSPTISAPSLERLCVFVI